MFTQSAGTGTFDTFVRIQGNGVESGYNTGGTPEFQSHKNKYTRALTLSEVPIVIYNGIAYREFCLDANQNSPFTLSIDELKFYVESTGNLTGYPTNFTNLVYNLDAGGDNSITINATLNAGSGKADMAALIPSALFGTDNSKYVYLYSTMGATIAASDGFEEWGVGTNAEPIYIPEPATLALLGLGSLLFLKRKV